MIIRSALKEYSILFDEDFTFLDSLIDEKNSFYVVDRKVYELYSHYFSKLPDEKVYLFDALENNKTMDSVLSICERMITLDAKRNAKLISFGGGIVQDVTGFVANIMYRGINWVFVPTTLLAACDSCIGGKTSLNYSSYKNLLGTFYPPDTIHICTKFFKTLSRGDVLSGLGEVIKFNVMAGINTLERIETNIDGLLDLDDKVVLDFVESSLSYKKKFIEEDEFDRGVRVLLNFAHTFGHAYEKVSSYSIPHGTAVALGTLTANHVSVMRGLMGKDIARRIEKLIEQIVVMPMKNEWFDSEKTISAMRKDKKQVGAEITAILMDDAFNLHIIRDLQEREIEQALIYIKDLFATFFTA